MPHIPFIAQSDAFAGFQGGQEQPARSEAITGKVKGKPPKVRPPRGIRDGLPPLKRLPGYSGPYNVSVPLNTSGSDLITLGRDHGNRASSSFTPDVLPYHSARPASFAIEDCSIHALLPSHKATFKG